MTRPGRAAAVVAVAVTLGVLAWTAPTTSDGSSAAGADEPTGAGTSSGVSTLTGGDGLPRLQPRANILVVMADDMRADELKYMPAVRRLIADQGVTFENSFSPFPLCCPARASFVTGQYTHNHGVWSNRDPYGFAALDDSHTVATLLDDAGYDTGFLGKYLNSYGRQPPPGEDEGNSLLYVPPGWDDWEGAVTGPPGWEGPLAGDPYHYWDMTLNENGVLRGHEGQYLTNMLGRRSTDAIARFARSPRPFFLWVSQVAPHTGFPREEDDPPPVRRDTGLRTHFRTPARPEAVRGMFDGAITSAPGSSGEQNVSDKPFFIRERPSANAEEQAGMRTMARQRAESLFVLDQQVKRAIDALDRAGELDDTYVVFMSDNGFFLGEHRIRLGKRLPYDASLHVPTLIRGPGIPAGEVRRDPMLTVDFAPTFLDIAGVAADPEMDGVSLLDVARDGDRGWTRPVLTESGPLPDALRTWDGGDLLDEPGGPSELRFSQGVRTARYLYVEHASRERELYDLRVDPGEMKNLAGRPGHARTARRLARMLDEMRECEGATCRARMPASFQGSAG